MNVRKVKHATHLWNYVMFTLLGVLAVVSVGISSAADSGKSLYDSAQVIFLVPLALVFLFFVYFVYVLMSFWFLHFQMYRRSKSLRTVAAQLGLLRTTFVPIGSALFSITKKLPRFSNSYSGNSWSYTDFCFADITDGNSYRREIYEKNTYFFAVAAFDLPRVLPNVFFDSKRVGGREFELLFREDQEHELEGDFNKYFKTYFTEDYSIDSLSFITPEVMLAIVEACDYDIEIFGNKLYLISELRNMPSQIIDMKKRGELICKKLEHNILAYKDDRIDSTIGRKTVSISGILLRRSAKKYSSMAFGGLIMASASPLLWCGGVLSSELAFFGTTIGLGVLVYAAMFIADIQRTNQSFRKLRNKGALY